jgi:hypothetical protein
MRAGTESFIVWLAEAQKGASRKTRNKEFFPNESHAIMRAREGSGSKNRKSQDFFLAKESLKPWCDLLAKSAA